MPVTFSQADEVVLDRLASVVRRHRPDLADVGVSWCVLMAESDDGGPAIVSKKVACLACVRVNPLRLRAQGLKDATIDIDLRAWADLSDLQQEAVLLHEVCHVELVKHWETKDGPDCTRDDLGRPKLRLRAGDLSPTDGFRLVIRECGSAAQEYRQWTAVGNEADVLFTEALAGLAGRTSDEADNQPEE
jgi:hypothetical protein